MKTCLCRIFIICTVILGLYTAASGAEPNDKQSKKSGGTAVGKDSKSNSPLIDKIKEVGNAVSEGVHRATQPIRDIGDKAGKTTKEPIKEK